MGLRRLNLISAAVAFLAAFAWLALAQSWAAVVWLAASLVWLLLAVFGSHEHSSRPVTQVSRRLLRLLMWG